MIYLFDLILWVLGIIQELASASERGIRPNRGVGRHFGVPHWPSPERSCLFFGISPVIGSKTLNQLASGILRVHGGETVKNVSFRFACSSSKNLHLVSCTAKSANLVPSVLERARGVPWGTIKTVSFAESDRRSGRRDISLPPFCLPPFWNHPVNCNVIVIK